MQDTLHEGQTARLGEVPISNGFLQSHLKDLKGLKISSTPDNNNKYGEENEVLFTTPQQTALSDTLYRAEQRAQDAP